MPFKDRHEAALRLIPLLEKYRNKKGVVLAIPRGGVPIAYYIAMHFGFPLELLMTKKIGHPDNEELAIGSVSLESQIIDPRYQEYDSYIQRETERLRQILKERYKLFKGDHIPISLRDKTVIIIDDGIATGNTMLASIELVKHHHPKEVVVAIPVAPPEAATRLQEQVDELLCLETPSDFMAVGQFYEDFSEVSDEEVVHLLHEVSQRKTA